LLIFVSHKWSIIVHCGWLAACIALRVDGSNGAVLIVFLRRWRKICTILQPMHGKQGQIPEEMSQTLLTNKKQGNLDLVQADNIIKPTTSRINRKKYTFSVNHLSG
jgi:hypothetical protein